VRRVLVTSLAGAAVPSARTAAPPPADVDAGLAGSLLVDRRDPRCGVPVNSVTFGPAYLQSARYPESSFEDHSFSSGQFESIG
jgi:hypothetical protein